MTAIQAPKVQNARTDQIVRFSSLAAAAVPFLAVLLLYIFAWDTSRAFGVWPTYGTPDPKDASSILYAATGIAAIALLPAMVMLGIVLPLYRRFSLQRADLAIIAAGVMGLVLLAAVFTGDLGNWYAD